MTTSTSDRNMTTAGEPVSLNVDAFLEKKISDFLFLYISPVIILFGTLGNILSLVILQSRHYKSTPTSIALSALALADIGVLNTGLLRHWIRLVSGINIRDVGNIFCKIHFGFTYLTQVLSGNILAVTSIERVLSVWFPLKVRFWITKQRMLTVIIFVSLFYLACHVPLFLDVNSNTYDSCEFSGYTFYYIWYWADLTMYVLVPFTIILISNILIIFGLRRAASKRAKQLSKTEDKKTSSTTVMLVVVGVVYLLTVSPVSILFLGYSYGAWSFDTPSSEAKYILAYTITQQLAYANSAINFLLYFCTGSKFRQALHMFFGTLCHCSE